MAENTLSGLGPTFDGEYQQYCLDLSLLVPPDACLNGLDVCDKHLVFDPYK